MKETVEERLDSLGTTETFGESEEPKTESAKLRYPSRFGLLTWPEITFNPGNNDLIKGVIELGSSALVYGESGCRKTFLVGDMGIHVALGRDWFGRKVLRRGVIYIAAEGGLSMRRRVEAFRLHHKIPKDQDIPFALIPSPVDLLDAKADLPELLALIDRVNYGFNADFGVPLGLVVIDTLSRVLSGGNENAPDDMGALVRNMDRIRAATGTATLPVHHAGKDSSKGGRGHSLVRAAMDTEIEVIKAQEQSTAKITKQRDGADGDTFTFGLQSVLLGYDADQEPVHSCVVVPVKGAADAKPSKAAPKQILPEYLKALDYLRDLVAAHGEIVAANNIPRSVKVVRVDLWREHLKQRGLHDGGENGKKWFQRVRSALIASDRVVINDPYVWIVPRGDHRDPE